MQYQIREDDQIYSIFYAETFSTFLKGIYQQWQDKEIGVLILANQAYYTQYAESFDEWEQHFAQLSWYICPNSHYCHTFSELENCLDYLKTASLHENTYLLLLGNDGVFHLGGFLSQNIPQIKQTVMITSSLKVVESMLDTQAEILYHAQPLLSCEFHLPYLCYDSATRFHDRNREKAIDFLYLVQIAMAHDYPLLQELFRAFPEREWLEKQSLSAFITPYLRLMERFYKLEKQKREQFFTLFTKINDRYPIENHHQLAIGLSLYLWISQAYGQFSFQTRNFLIWLIRLGYHLEIPEQILTTDLAEQICSVLTQYPKFLFLSAIGKSEQKVTINCEKLTTIIDDYRKMIDELINEKRKNECCPTAKKC